MTFLQPFILYGLPLILLPVIIHLLNRLRYRTQQWAAMRFLLSAQKQSIRRSRLRQWIVLLMRMLAVLAIIIFLARPMTGGWSGFFSSGEPEIILLALDRSASMETLLPNGETRRERVLRNFAEAASVREGSTVVLVENVYRDPQPLASAADLLNPDMERYVGPTDTTSDVPALLTTALDWLEENEVGSAEVWIASDLRANDWVPDGSEPRWKRLAERLAKVGEKYALRLVNYVAETGENARLRCEEVVRSKNLLRCSMALDRDKATGGSLFLEVFLDGERSEMECSFEGTTFLWQPELKVDAEKTEEGWGKFSLPNDGNPGDDEAYFVYGYPKAAKGTTIAENPIASRALATASMNFSNGGGEAPVIRPPGNLNPGELDASSFLFWQGPLPRSSSAEMITGFVEKGGVVVFLPPEGDDDGVFAECSWGKADVVGTEEKPFNVTSWEQRAGPLADTAEGLRLPLDEVSVGTRRNLNGNARSLAFFEDGTPFLSRIALGKGEIYFLCTLPIEGWSDLADGFTLVPVAQRLLKTGSRRFDPPTSLPCGTPGLAPPGAIWQCVDDPGQKDLHARAGIYRVDGRLVALNRPAAEDESSTLGLDECRALFGERNLATLEGSDEKSSEIPAEIWRAFLFLTLAALVAEAFLVMPNRESSEGGLGEHQGSEA